MALAQRSPRRLDYIRMHRLCLRDVLLQIEQSSLNSGTLQNIWILFPQATTLGFAWPSL